MAKQLLTLQVPIDDSYDAGDTLQVFTDFGSGTVDTSKPLLAKTLAMFPTKHPAAGVGRTPVGVGRLGDMRPARPVRGIGAARTGRTPLGTAPVYLAVNVEVPAAFGKWKFAARITDRFGVVQGGALQTFESMVSGIEPPALEALTFQSVSGGQAIFGFTRGSD
jgi:hypothetical protein